MLSIKMLNHGATLNNFFYVGSVSFVPGEDVKIIFQLLNKEIHQRLIPDTAATVDVTFQLIDGTELVKSATKLFGNDDKSVWKVELSQAESATIIGSNIKVTVNDVEGASTYDSSAIAYNVLQRDSFDGEC